MASSQEPTSLGCAIFSALSSLLPYPIPPRTPGSLGVNDAADPARSAWVGDTPSSLGIKDHGSPDPFVVPGILTINCPNPKDATQVSPVMAQLPSSAGASAGIMAAHQLTLSEKGFAFIYRHEAGPGSNRLYHPSSDSGVTLGPGYDMGSRRAAQIVAQLTRIGVSQEVAQKVSAAAGLSGIKAEAFVKDNQDLVSLTDIQQQQLLRTLLPSCMKTVSEVVSVKITQDQFDALVSLDFNIGPDNFGDGNPVVDYLNQGDSAKAAGSFWIWRRSGKEISAGLVQRRKSEALYFNSGQPVINIPFGNTKPPQAIYK